MAVRIQLRNDTAANWTDANPVLAAGEFGLEKDTNYFKIGDGTSSWNDLPYGGIQGLTGETGGIDSIFTTTTSNWSEPTPATISEALEDLAARLSVLEEFFLES
jgi:hypothetical protein